MFFIKKSIIFDIEQRYFLLIKTNKNGSLTNRLFQFLF